MAEAAGLLLGVISLPTLFATCVELANYIELARNLGSDYEATYTKLLLLKSRLIALGNHPILLDERHMNQPVRGHMEHERLLVGRSLVAIKHILEDADGLKQKYGLQREGEGNHLLLEVKHSQSSTLQEVENVLQTSVNDRRQRVSFGKKIVWAVRDKKAFDSLICELTFYISELESLLARSGAQHFRPDIPSNIPLAASQLLEAASAQSDNSASKSVSKWGKSQQPATSGHLYLDNQIRERARVVQGNIGEIGRGGLTHAYTENQISGDAKVIQGNATGGEMQDFWKA